MNKNYKSYCEMCERDIVICGKCGNNTCNGGHGTIDGVKCDQCPSAYEEATLGEDNEQNTGHN